MAKTKKKPDLTKYSKEDLIWIINRMSAFGDDWSLGNALRELEYSKDIKRIKDAEKIAKQSHKLRQEYIDLLMPFDGKPINEIPLDILEKASAAMKQAQSLDKKWNKLMGIGGKDG
jgi:hypothetical protein